MFYFLCIKWSDRSSSEPLSFSPDQKMRTEPEFPLQQMFISALNQCGYIMIFCDDLRDLVRLELLRAGVQLFHLQRQG